MRRGSSWFLYDSRYDTPVVATYLSLLKYTFVSQSFYCGTVIGYNFLKRLYGYKVSINFFELLRDRVIGFILGFSYVIMGFSKEVSIAIVDSFYDEELLRKNNKVKIFFRLVLLRVLDIQNFVFNYNKNKLKNYRITVDSVVSFNPPRSRSVNDSIRSTERLFGINKGHSKIDHLAIKDSSSNPQTHLTMTTHPLEGQLSFNVHGLKEGSSLVYNNISNSSLYKDDSNHHINKIAEYSGANDVAMVDNMKNTADLLRMGSECTTYQHSSGKNNVKIIKKSFYKSALQLRDSGLLHLDSEKIDKYRMIAEATSRVNGNDLFKINKSMTEELSFRNKTKHVSIHDDGDESVHKFEKNGSLEIRKTNSVTPTNFVSVKDILVIIEKNLSVANKESSGYQTPFLKTDKNNFTWVGNKYLNEDGGTKSPDRTFTDF